MTGLVWKINEKIKNVSLPSDSVALLERVHSNFTGLITTKKDAKARRVWKEYAVLKDSARFQRALDEDLFLACAMGAAAIVLLVSASRAAKKGR